MYFKEESTDEWPKIYERVKAANIVVVGTSIWLREKTQIRKKFIELILVAISLSVLLFGLISNKSEYSCGRDTCEVCVIEN